MRRMDELLTLSGVVTDIGAYHILHGVDLTVRRGRVTMLLGRNGAGKTTTLRSIMGLWRPRAGAIRFDGADLVGLDTPDIARRGIAYVPENMGIFSQLTVAENMKLAAIRAGLMSGGQKQILAVARAIVEERRLMIIDEPTKGLAPAVIDQLIACLLELKARDTTILLVEQNFHMARSVGDDVAVMDNGVTVHVGPMAELAADTDLQTRLLGLSLAAHQ
jgi:branched-chain amino acid transport system ATP-binding protein